LSRSYVYVFNSCSKPSNAFIYVVFELKEFILDVGPIWYLLRYNFSQLPRMTCGCHAEYGSIDYRYRMVYLSCVILPQKVAILEDILYRNKLNNAYIGLIAHYTRLIVDSR